MQSIGRHIIRYKTIESTNDHAIKLIAKSKPIEGTVISADFQTKGKGQRSNKWQSEAEKNLLFSIILYPVFLRVNKQFYLSMFAANAILHALETELDAKKLSIKWPNDIYFENKKLGGMLIQNTLKADRIESCVIGIGINVNQASFDKDLPNPGSMFLEKGSKVDIPLFSKLVFDKLDQSYQDLLNNKLEVIKRNFESKLYLRDQLSVVNTRQGPIEGIIKGVEEDGRLKVLVNGKMSLIIH